MENLAKIIRVYSTVSGKKPFKEWLKSIKDIKTQARIQKRIRQLEAGNYGDFKSVGDKVYELRLHFGSGYRVYFGEVDNVIIILLSGGDKSTQTKDIKKAKEYWNEFRSRLNG